MDHLARVLLLERHCQLGRDDWRAELWVTIQIKYYALPYGLLKKNNSNTGIAFGLSLLYLIIGPFVSFTFWYRPFYYAVRYVLPPIPFRVVMGCWLQEKPLDQLFHLLLQLFLPHPLLYPHGHWHSADWRRVRNFLVSLSFFFS